MKVPVKEEGFLDVSGQTYVVAVGKVRMHPGGARALGAYYDGVREAGHGMEVVRERDDRRGAARDGPIVSGSRRRA